MPHITLEYSSNLNLGGTSAALFEKVHARVQDIAGVKIENCKSRAYVADEYRVGRGDPESAFIHLSVRFIEGRSSERKQALGVSLCELLREAFAVGDSDEDIQVTVEVSDIRLDEYCKFPAGSLTKQG